MRILIDHTQRHETEGHDIFYFLLVDFYGARLLDSNVEWAILNNPKTKAIIEKMQIPTTDEADLQPLFQALLSAIKKIPNIQNFYYTRDQLNVDGTLNFSLLQAYNKLNGPLESDFCEQRTFGIPASEIVTEESKKKFLFSFFRFQIYSVPVLINRSIYEVKSFLIKGDNQNESIIVHCYLNGIRIIRVKVLRQVEFDTEQADYCLRALKKHLNRQYIFNLTSKVH